MYRDPVIGAYISLIKEKTGGVFKEYYQGDPIRIPTSLLPCVIVSKTETRIGRFDNMRDTQSMQMVITVVTDIRQDWSDDTAIQNGISRLYDIIEGRTDDMKLKETSLLYILRENDMVGTLRTDLGTITRASYGLTVDKRAENGFAIEAQVEFISQFIE